MTKHFRNKPSSSATALTVVSETSTELALPIELLKKARGYASKSRSERTLKEYARCWKQFGRWCDQNQRDPLPASTETLVGYITWMAGGQDNGKSIATSTIAQAFAAIKFRHKSKGYLINSDTPELQAVLSGVRREIAKTRGIRRVQALTFDKLQDILNLLDPAKARDARDGALLALACGAALRRSELVGLDWAIQGQGAGFVTSDDKGLTVTLMTSKASQDAAETVAIPRADAPLMCSIVEDWVAKGQIAKGSPLFRTVGNRMSQKVGESRLHARTVPRIVKRRVYEMIKSQNKGKKKITTEEAKALTEMFAGHSMRVGFVTSAAERNMATHKIQQQTRHKTAAMVNIYVREVDKFKNSALKGVGF